MVVRTAATCSDETKVALALRDEQLCAQLRRAVQPAGMHFVGLHDHALDLVVTDQASVLREIRAISPSPSVLLVVADDAPDEEVAMAFAEGAADVIRGIGAPRFLELQARMRRLGRTADALSGYLTSVIESSVDAIVSADRRGRIVLFNQAAERIFGCAATDRLGMSVATLYPPGTAQRVMALLRSDAYGGQGRLIAYRMEIVAAGGERIPVSLSASFLGSGNSWSGTVGILTDLRERMRIERRLEVAQEQLRMQERQTLIAELAGAAAHELNQPLTSVMGYAELVRRRVESNTQLYSAAEIILNEAERMAEIVRKISRITRYETKNYVGSARILDLERSTREDVEPVSKAGGA